MKKYAEENILLQLKYKKTYYNLQKLVNLSLEQRVSYVVLATTVSPFHFIVDKNTLSSYKLTLTFVMCTYGKLQNETIVKENNKYVNKEGNGLFWPILPNTFLTMLNYF